MPNEYKCSMKSVKKEGELSRTNSEERKHNKEDKSLVGALHTRMARVLVGVHFVSVAHPVCVLLLSAVDVNKINLLLLDVLRELLK